MKYHLEHSEKLYDNFENMVSIFKENRILRYLKSAPNRIVNISPGGEAVISITTYVGTLLGLTGMMAYQIWTNDPKTYDLALFGTAGIISSFSLGVHVAFRSRKSR